jgi:hypothetical protein
VAYAMTVEDFLGRHQLSYENVSHAPADTSLESARARLMFRRSEWRKTCC